MKRIFQKIDNIRARGSAVLNVLESNPLSIYNGQRFKVIEMGKADHKCRVSLLIKNRRVDLQLTDVL